MSEEETNEVKDVKEDVSNHQGENESESSTDESLEDLKAENEKLKESNEKLVTNLRNQEEKRSLSDEEEEGEEEEQDALIERKVAEQLNQQTKREEKSALSEFLSADDGKRYQMESDDGEDNFKQLQKAYKAIEVAKGAAVSKEEKLKFLKIADIVVREDIGARSADDKADIKAAASGPGASTIRNDETVTEKVVNEKEKKWLEFAGVDVDKFKKQS